MQLTEVQQLKIKARNALQGGAIDAALAVAHPVLEHVADVLSLTPVVTLGIGRRPGSKPGDDDFWLTARIRTPLAVPALEESVRKTLTKIAGADFDLHHTGPVRALQPAPFAGAAASTSLKIGASVGLFNLFGGTLGFFAKSRGDNTRGFVSANHVIANLGRQVTDKTIVSPSLSTHPIGELVRSTHLDGGGRKHTDAAFAKLDTTVTVDRSSLPQGQRLSGAVALPRESTGVMKVGIGTHFTKGHVTSFDNDTFSTSEFAGFDHVDFKDQIEVSPGDFADRGDSGALVYNNLGHAVGLLFAVADGHAYVNPIQFVLDELQVDIDVLP